MLVNVIKYGELSVHGVYVVKHDQVRVDVG